MTKPNNYHPVWLFGKRWLASFAPRRCAYIAMIDLDDASRLDWRRGPTRDESADGIPIWFCIHLNGREQMFDSAESLRVAIDGLRWEYAHPNTARLHDIRENIDDVRRQYRSGQDTERGRLVLRFSWEKRRSCWESEHREGDTRVVYVASMQTRYRVKHGVEMACVTSSVSQNLPPDPISGRPGFRLVVVNVLGQYVDPDAEIVRLEAEIAAGHP